MTVKKMFYVVFDFGGGSHHVTGHDSVTKRDKWTAHHAERLETEGKEFNVTFMDGTPWKQEFKIGEDFGNDLGEPHDTYAEGFTEGHDEGFDEGHTAGHAEGFEEGLAAA